MGSVQSLLRIAAWLAILAVSRPLLAAEPDIPARTTTPPTFTQNGVQEIFGCKRQFLYRGQYLSCDSIMSRDAEGFRPIFQPVPAAIAELDQYQKNRRGVQTVAYVSSAGLALVALGYILGTLVFRVSSPATLPDGSVTTVHSPNILLRNLIMLPGLITTVGAISYGVFSIGFNENHLGNAVKLYNQARPNDPVDLQFSTGVKF